MKLPPKNDPHGDAEGALLRGQVLDALFRHGITVRHADDGTVTVETDDVVEIVILPDLVGGLMIRHLSRTLGIPITDFYYGQRARIN